METRNNRWSMPDLYHDIYGFMQNHRLLGAWERVSEQHSRVIEKSFSSNHPVSVLYCGTATNRNPQFVVQTFRQFGILPSIVTIDLSSKPLDLLVEKRLNPVQADSSRLPFANEVFDYITTDFLLSKMPLNAAISTIFEWGRVLRKGGVISTTIGIQQSQDHQQCEFTESLAKLLYGVRFIPKEIFKYIFKMAGFEVNFEQARFDQKPFLYLYPDELLLFVTARRM